MAVSFTPNIALAKPDKNELADNWVGGTELIEDNNNIITDEMDISRTTWNPAVVGPTTNPNLGATATKFAEYYEVQGYIFGLITIEVLGAGIAPGTGTGGYGFSLPVNVDNAFHTCFTGFNDAPGISSVVGEGYYFDSDVIANSGSVAVDVGIVGGTHYARLIMETYAGRPNHFVGPSVPAAIATGDRISFNFFYKGV